MSDPRQDFLDVLERAVQHVPHFTTPTTIPINTSWGTFFDSSEILAAWLALDDKDRAESVIDAVTGYINRVNEMATDGKELCARVALHFGDEKRAAGLYGITREAVTGKTLPPLQLVPEIDDQSNDERDDGERDREHGETNDPPEAGVEPLDIGAALRARYPSIPAIDHATLDDAVDLLHEAARAVKAGLDPEILIRAAAEPDEHNEASDEASAGPVPGHLTPDLTADLVHAAETARDAAGLLHAAAMRLDACSKMAGVEREPWDTEPDSEPLVPDLEATPQPEDSPESASSNTEPEDTPGAPGAPSTATGARSAPTCSIDTQPDPDETRSRPLIVIDATWSESEPTSSKSQAAPSARSSKPSIDIGEPSIDIARYVPRWQLHLVATAAIMMAMLSAVLWASDTSSPTRPTSSQPQSGERRPVAIESSTPSPTPIVEVSPGEPGAESEEQPESLASSKPTFQEPQSIGEPEIASSPRIVSKPIRSDRKDDRELHEAVASDHGNRAPPGSRNPTRSSRRNASKREPMASKPAQQSQPIAPAPVAALATPAFKESGVVLSVPMGTVVEIQPEGANPYTIAVSRQHDPLEIPAKYRARRAGKTTIPRVPGKFRIQ